MGSRSEESSSRPLTHSEAEGKLLETGPGETGLQNSNGSPTSPIPKSLSRPIWLWDNITKLNAALAFIVTLVTILATGVTVARHYLPKSTAQKSSRREKTTPFEHKNLEVTSPLPTPQSYDAVSIPSPTSGTVECEVIMFTVDDTGQPLLLDNLRDIVHQDTTSARPACKVKILSLEAEDKATPSCREGWAEVATLKYEMSDIRTHRIVPQHPVSSDPQCDTREEPIDKRAALIGAVLKFRRALVNERSVLVNGESQ